MRFLTASLLVFIFSIQSFAADDPAPVGSVYEGILKRFGLPDEGGSLISSHGCRLTITERDGEKFTGTLWVVFGDKKLGCEIQGTISNQGGVKFTPTKPLNADSATGDVLGRAQFVGAVKEGTLSGKYTIPNNANVGKLKRNIPRFGRLDLKLKTDA